jgi:hypothetical protein
MQTFLPYDNFNLSLEVLDYRRLGKQRVESFQLLNALLGRTESKGWINHPIAKMWKGYENALKLYLNKSIEIWKSQGYNNTMKYEDIKGEIIYPDWFGNEDFHTSHKSNLLRKDYDFYSEYGWKDNPNNPYVWYDTQKKQFYKHIVKTGQKKYIK